METQPKKTGLKWWQWALIIIIGLAVIGKIMDRTPSAGNTNTPADSLANYEKARQDTLGIAKYKAEEALKGVLRDPDSYDKELREAYFVTGADAKKIHIQVVIKYRAKNGFGGTNLETRVFDFDNNLRIVNSFKKE
jgi:hypothetical protein